MSWMSRRDLGQAAGTFVVIEQFAILKLPFPTSIGSRRRAPAAYLMVFAAALAAMFPTSALCGEEPEAQVLFVCEHGNVKSLMAASYFNLLAHERKLPYRAISRGTSPDSTTVPLAIVAGLQNDGVDVTAFQPTAVGAADIAASQHLVLINTEWPANSQVQVAKVERWSDVPPASVNFDAARDSLKAHVVRLIDQLEHSSPK
jgi:arsenate reductase (thioredoxin)